MRRWSRLAAPDGGRPPAGADAACVVFVFVYLALALTTLTALLLSIYALAVPKR